MKDLGYFIAFTLLMFGFSLQAQTTLISYGSEWKYLDDGSDQGTVWRQNSYDDSAWAEGNAQLGYGDGDENTVLSYGPSSSHKYITYYFRQTFSVSSIVTSNLVLHLLRDDGAVVYLNGNEVVRSNMPSGTITYLTLSASTVGGSEENVYHEYTIPSGDLLIGDNVIAVEIHQRSNSSSDISFDMNMEYEGTTNYCRKAPYLLAVEDNTQAQLIWQLSITQQCSLLWGDDLTYSLGSATTNEYGSDHQHTYTISGLNPGMHYYYKVIISPTEEKVGDFVCNPPDTTTQITFYAYGDTRTYPSAHNQVAQRMVMDYTSEPANQSIVFSTGDLVANGNNESDWDNQFFSPQYIYIQKLLSQLPYAAAIGNHEGQGVLFEKYFPYSMFTSGRYYYSMDYGPVHFTIIDQFTDYSVGSEQYNWLVNDLASSQKQWKILIFHKPGWSAGGHSNNTNVQTRIQPLCLEYDVKLVLNGHNHYYSRADVDGVMHITTGGGGAGLSNPNASYPYIVKVDKSHHFIKITVDGNTLDFTAIRDDGSEIESFTLTNSLLPSVNFEADNTSPYISEAVHFTDLSTHTPTSWNWSFSPSTFSFINGTNANSQHPEVKFEAAGDYSVTLSAGNSYGTNSTTKVSYIHVQTDPYCLAQGGGNEYISQVNIEGVVNSSTADTYTYYPDAQIELARGLDATISISNGNVTNGDDLGVWIDWNQNADFSDPGEIVVCETDEDGQGTFTFPVPDGASLGSTRMRIRIKRLGSDCSSSCGNTAYGEVEDYLVSIVDAYQLDLHLWLEGAYNGTNMNAANSSIALQQPFDIAPWNYHGNEQLATIPTDMVDWVLVEIRDANNASQASSSTIIKRKAAILRSDGKILDISGSSNLRMAFDYDHKVNIVIWHRNHLGLMSSTPPFEDNGLFTYNFTYSSGQVYGGSSACINLQAGVWGMISGDADHDGNIDTNDIQIWKTQAGKSGYLDGDFDLNQQIENGDKNEFWLENQNRSSYVPD
jgi:PKD repeat protein